MEIVKQITPTLYLVLFACFGQILGNTVSLHSASGYVGESLELTCTLTPTTSPSLLTINWFLNDNSDSIQRDASTCSSALAPASYTIARYAFTCNGNTFKLKILSLQNSDNNDCWSCSVSFSSADPETAKASACIVAYITTQEVPGGQTLGTGEIVGIVVGAVVFVFCACCSCYCKKKTADTVQFISMKLLETNSNEQQMPDQVQSDTFQDVQKTYGVSQRNN